MKKRTQKMKFNYFMKRKIVIGICLLLVFVGGVVTVLALIGNEEEIVEKPKVDNTIPAECLYTLEELEEAVNSGWLYGKYAWRDYGEDANDMAYVLFHFYDYFSKDTEFIVWDTYNIMNGEITYKKISYDEYMEYRDDYYRRAQDMADKFPYAYHSWLRSMMWQYVTIVKE